MHQKLPSHKLFCSSKDQKRLLKTMIRCHLGRLLGERKLKISDVARDTGINRGTLTRLYQETVERIEVDAIVRLCRYLGVTVADLLEYQPEE